MTITRPAVIAATATLLAVVGLSGCSSSDTDPTPAGTMSSSDAMMEESAKPSDAMMEESAKPSDAMMEESTAP